MPDVTQYVDIASEYPDLANTTAEARDPDTEVLEQVSAVLDSPTASGVRYLPAFTNLPAGEWLIVHKDSNGEKLGYGYVTVTLTDGTFKVYGSRAAELPALASTIGTPAGASLAEDIAAVKTDAENILTKFPSNFIAQWSNVYALQISGITTDVENVAGRHSNAATIMMSTNGSIADGVWTAKKPSDDTVFETYTVTTSNSANNITGVS